MNETRYLTVENVAACPCRYDEPDECGSTHGCKIEPKVDRASRRNMRDSAAKRLKSSKAYGLITWDGKSLPVFHFDLTACEDHDDARHCAMHAAAEAAVAKLSLYQAAVNKKAAVVEQAEKVEEAKEKRSEELAAA